MIPTAVRAVLGALVLASATAVSAVVTAPAAHAADRDCSDFSSQRDAQIFFLNSGGPQSDPHRLDADGDGVVCESNPGPYYYGTTLPGGGGGDDQPAPAPEPQVSVVRSAVRLAVSPRQRIAGEPFRLTVSVRPAISRDVVVQRKVDGRWRYFGSGTTGRNGVTHGDFKAAATRQTYRAVLQAVTRGSTRYTAATSEPRTLAVQRQRVVLQVSDRTVGEGERVTAVVRATPVRKGRPVVVQLWTGQRWRTVRTGEVDGRGVARFALAPALGRSSFRAVVLRSQGAASQTSAAVAVSASDRTPPPAPFDLVAETDAGTITLSWSRAIPDDFDHHEVWMRTEDTSWSVLDTTQDTTFALENQEAGVTYSFTVTSVDTAGNRSAGAEVVTVTLEDPVAGGARRGW